jgi:putative ABC transport system ATP-binding protein
MVTHEPDIAAYTRRTIVMRDGEIVSDKAVERRRNAAEDLLEWKREHTHLMEAKGAAT